jgi:isopentenyl diphosphate isomerase/L-lactate dehydrogenase-like FMN-dependent dehydrogenase
MDQRDARPSRRAFLRFLAGSPLLAPALPARAGAPQSENPETISSPEEAINVFDFERVAEKALPPAHFGYLATGVDDDATLRANRDGFQTFQLRMRRLVDVRRIDLSTAILGTRWPTPIVLAPAGSQRAFHEEGELAVARAAREKGHLQILSTVTTTSVEEVTEARGAPVWFQLYPTWDWKITQALVKRAEGAGCPVLVLTVDLQGGSNRETLSRFKKLDPRPCEPCHAPEGDFASVLLRKPLFEGLDLKSAGGTTPEDMTWDFVDRLKDLTSMKLLIKGIVTGEDAELAVARGADGIIVSNHGGRAEESARGTIECLPEVAEAVSRRVPVLLDGGIRRGTDVFKALALGADAVCIGRPYLWGLAAFGQSGVETVLSILRRELEMVMKQAGTTSVAGITRDFVVEARRSF